MKMYEVNTLNRAGEILTSGTFVNFDEALENYKQTEKSNLCQLVINYGYCDTDEHLHNYKITNGIYRFADRNQYLLNQCVYYLKELLTNDETAYAILYEGIGFEDNELLAFGFNVEAIKKNYETN